MKKLTIAIALLLCLVMCVFCFASCKKKNKKKTEATTEATTTAHVHTPAADYTVDLQPTCVKAGSKSKHCTGCNEIIPETVTTIPATGEHTVAEWTEIPSTLIRAGSKSGTCTVCRQTITENFEKTKPIVYLSNWDLETRNANAYTIANPDDSTIKTFGIKKNVKGIIGDSGIFYPTEENDKGNDLLIEFSFLYNDTMANAGDGVLTAMYVENYNVFNVDLKTGKITARIRTADEGGPDTYVYPTEEAIAADETKKEVAIGAYGWHRFGMRIHEDAKIEADAVVYTVTATAYLDGAKIMEVDKTAWATHNFAGDYTGLLYTATIEEGKLTYKNAVDDGKHCDAYVMVEELPKESENPGYLVVGDIAMTCGQEFDQKVFALKDPAAATLEVAEGVTLPAAFYYVSEHDHVWDGDPSVVVAATLLSDGLRKKTCSICGEQGELVAYACEPTQWTYTTETATANKMETKIEDILGEDKHFYPDESNGGKGLDLYIEYSILWNETLVKLNAGSDDMVVYGSLWGQDAYWLSLTNNAHGSSCPYAGGFEFISLRTVEFGPHGMSELTANGNKTGDQFTDFPNIGGADQAHPEYGWHRVAIVFHEDVLKDSGVVSSGTTDNIIDPTSYKMTSTCYVDGVKIYTLTNASDAEFKASTMKNGTLLFKTNEENAPFTYTDVAGDKIVTGLEIPVKKTSEGNAYVLIADYSVTAGKDFVQKVEKAPNAAEKTITVAEGVTLPAKVWYKEAMDVDVLTLNSATSQDYALTASLEDEVLAGGRHFYPTEENPDGNDLYIECAILWNETVVNNCVGNLTTGTCKPDKYESPVRTSWMALNSGGGNGCDCQYAGGFEYCDLVKHDEETPAGKTMAGDTSPFDEFPNIGGADQANPEYGWHYLTMKIHQEVTNADALKADTVAGATKALYKYTNTVYVDGVKLIELSYSGDGQTGDPSGKAYWGKNMAHALFQATSDGQGGIKYNDTTRGVFVDVNAKAKDANVPGYFVYADLNFTCGKAPVHNVVKVADPAAATFTYNEVDIPAAMYFAY